MSSRCYLFPDEGAPLRVPQRLLDGLIFGRDAMPQYTGTRQRVLSVTLENADRRPIRILDTQGSIWEFDREGRIDKALQKAAFEAMNRVAFSPERREGTVVDLGSRKKRKQFDDEHRWMPTREDLDTVAADIWPKSKNDRLKSAEGTAQRRPPLTRDAEVALRDASQNFYKFNVAIERLKEPGLKSFIFAARERMNEDPEDQFLYRALAEMGERRLEILRRHRSGKGVWYAVVDVTRWDSQRVGTDVGGHHERCDGKAAAVQAARRMLAENADRLSDDVTVEASIVTDLEWWG